MTRTMDVRPCEEGATADLADLVDAMYSGAEAMKIKDRLICPHCDAGETMPPERVREGVYLCPVCSKLLFVPKGLA